MEVKPGYKLTEVGVIPKDWEVKSLSAVSSMKSGEGITASRIDQYSQYPCYGGNGLRGFTSRYTHDGAFALIGRQGALCGNVVGVSGQLFASEHAVVVTPRQGTNIQFLTYVLGEMHLNRLSEASAQPGLSVSKILQLSIGTPPTEAEQRAIASALSDVDALLAGLDRLIAKRRDLKQAAMQQLLTGQTRLPGFHGEWEVKRLGEVLTIGHGRSQRDVVVPDGPYPILASGGQIGTASRPLYDKPSVLIGRKGTIDQPQYMATPFWTVDTLFYSALKDGNDAKFFFYRFCLIRWMQFNEASGVPSLNARTIERIELECPEPLEQTAIAAVLSDMDAELAGLETRRDKTRDLKQAMMQELLTGKTRLV
jgi:type I restriction enzyme S subunit